MSTPLNITVSMLMSNVDTTLENEAAHMDRVHGPLWEARSDVVRNLVAVGVAVFAGTVTFLEGVASSACTLGGALLLASWALLVISVSAGLFSLWQSITLRSFYPRLFNSRPRLRAEFQKLDLTRPDAIDRSAEILKAAIDAVVGPMGVADTRGQIGARVCMVCFFGSMMFFLGYAVTRLWSGT